MKKRLLSIILALCMALTLLPGTALAAESGTCGNNLTWTLEDDGTLTISGTGAMVDYSLNDSRWAGYQSSIKEVVVGDDVTSIGDHAFSECVNLTSITIPEGVLNIGDAAFDNCENLTSITIPESVTNIGMSAFSGCTSLSRINIPENVTSIEDYTFYRCRSLSSITIPESVTSIGFWAFENCRSLSSITIPESVAIIANGAFAYCTSLTSITIPDNVTAINRMMFFGCTSLSSITIPESVISIGELSFNECESLTSITIPKSVTSIGSDAFCGCTGLSNIIIPDDVTSIGSGAFYRCMNLASITIPDSITVIEQNTFYGCYNLSDVLYSGTKAQWSEITIEESNDSLKNATIHCSDGVIYPSGGTNGNTLTWSLKDGVLTISGEGPMDDYTVFVEAQARSVEGHPMPVSREARIAAPWYSRMDEVEKIVIQEGITSIGDYAFNGFYNVTSVELPDSLTSIGFAAFDQCSALPSVRIPKNVTEIGTYAFGCGHSLKEILVDEANQSFCSVNGVLYTKDKTKLVQFPAGLDGMYRIPSGTTTIGTWAFDSCYELQALVIPVSITRIEETAFFSCVSLEDVYYPGSESQWKKIEGIEELGWLDAAIHYNSNGDEWVPKGRMPDAIKYIPYEYRTADDFTKTSDNMSWTECYYERAPGSVLPSGLILDRETGVISGAPQTAVSGYQFAIRRVLSYGNGGNLTEELNYILNIVDNSDNAVRRPNDYEITSPVGSEDPSNPNHFLKDSYTDEVMVIDGPYDEFMALYLDGGKLTRNEDYTARAGSTVITIRAQTFRRAGEGTHTISAEYREGGSPTGALKRVSQNYTLTLPKTSSSSSPGRGGGSGVATSKKTQEQQQQQQTTQNSVLPFTDVSASDWFYEDLLWAYENGFFSGYADGTFQPQRSISQATIVTVLARLAKVDLSQFTGEEEPGVEQGRQFTEAAVWARRSGLLPEGGIFTGDETTTRNQMAVMLVKYLQSMGKDVTAPEMPVVFADEADMSPEGVNAFQVLYHKGIFKGTGGLNMNPTGSTTRAHFVALIHRIYEAAMSDD